MPRVRKNRQVVVKTFNLPPDLVEDMERVVYFLPNEYPHVTALIISAASKVVEQERRRLESEGVAWESLRPQFKHAMEKE
ncbi:MAG: hypothetical protein PHQ43_01105 [Dehalococcoidales bacterium]|nr:hypothetical protein [Dehalococcoidales bacterium]